MDLKSGLWRHMLETFVDWEDYVASVQTIRATYKTPVKSSLLSCNNNILSRYMSFMSRWSDIMLWLLHFRSCNTCTSCTHFSLPTFAVLQHATLFFGVVRYIIKHLFYESAWSILFWNHANDVTSLVKIHREYSPAARILHTKFD